MRHYMPVLVYGHDGDIRADMVEVEPYNGLYCLSIEAYAEIDRLRALLLDCDAFIDRHYGGANLMKGRISTALPNSVVNLTKST